MNRSDLKKYLADPNVKAFLMMIRVGEGTEDEDGYRRMFGGELFDSFADHPRRKVTKKLGGKPITSSAAGAGQFLMATWDSLISQYHFPDFSPECQDEAMVALIARRGALNDVVNNNVTTAIRKCNKEWASLPESPYGQPTTTMEKALKLYAKYGGNPVAQARTAKQVVADNVLNPNPLNITFEKQPEEDTEMFPFIAAALPALLNAAPDLIRVFGDSPIAERNAKAAEKVVEIAKTVTGATSSEEAVTKIETDPAMAAAFREQARKDFLEIEAMADKRVESARQFNKDEAPIFKGKYANVKFVHILSTLVVLGALLGIGFILIQSVDATERAMALQALLLTGFAGVMAYWTGSSNGSEKKTELLDKRAGE